MTTRDDTSPHPPTAWQRLKHRSLSVESIRMVDQLAVERYAMNSLVLMENAAIGCAQWITSNYSSSTSAVILCGRGNNGGDGLAIARHLLVAGWDCHVVQLGPIHKLSPDALANWRILTARSSEHCSLCDESSNDRACEPTVSIAERIRRAGLIVDALLGSGAQGAPRAPISDWIHRANESTALRLAVDIPTGLDARTGEAAATTFRAQATLTFVARKVGFDNPSAREYLGDVEVLPIGIPVELIEELLR